MRSHLNTILARSLFVALCISVGTSSAHTPHICPEDIVDEPSFANHMDQVLIDDGSIGFVEVYQHGKELFTAQFNTCDGHGRPATMGCQLPRNIHAPGFSRVAGPEANGCSGCHSMPRPGGAGGFAGNAFAGANCSEDIATSVSEDVGSMRNTPSTFGAGAIDQLAREMSNDLKRAARRLPDGWNTVLVKNVPFQLLVENRVVIDSIGVDPDLIIKPFGHAGDNTTLREFSRNASNQHHGMQAEEIFDLDPNRGVDYDQDGVANELSKGDITAMTIFQAASATPIRVRLDNEADQLRADNGEQLFSSINCVSCHTPEMKLSSSTFDDGESLAFNMSTTGEENRLVRGRRNTAVVNPYTDLKMHNLCDPIDMTDAIRHFCNERHPGDGRRTQLTEARESRPGLEFFQTAKLWVVGNTPPYGHRGDLTSIDAAILAHGGDGRASRDAYAALPLTDREDVVKFLNTLQAPENEGNLLVNGVIVQ